MSQRTELEAWPDLPYSAWKDTCATLHLWTQIVGKVRLALTPWLNHSWHVPLYVTARGLTTSPIPYGQRTFEIDFDFVAHALDIIASDGARRAHRALAPQSVAEFYGELMAALDGARHRASGSTSCRTRCRTPSRSPRTRRTPPTTPSTRTASGGCSCRRTACSSSSAPASSASAARCISSGAASTSR